METAVVENKMVMSVPAAAKILGISETKMYQLCKSSGFPTVKIGKRILVSSKGLERWIDQQAAKGWSA